MENIEELLFQNRDEKYKNFHKKLIPNVPERTIIGIRNPVLHKIAKDLVKKGGYSEFFAELPHKYYDENVLQGLMISEIKDFETCIAEVEKFLPFVDNWAVCDTMCPKVFKKNKPALLEYIKTWLKSEHTYTVRFGIKMLMDHFLDDGFSPEYPKAVAEIEFEEYYVKMMQAWYFATALAKRYDTVLPYLTEQKLEPWVHNKSIQKAVESYRITPEQKEYLKTLKIK